MIFISVPISIITVWAEALFADEENSKLEVVKKSYNDEVYQLSKMLESSTISGKVPYYYVPVPDVDKIRN